MTLAMVYTARINIASPAASATLPLLQLALAAGKPVRILRLEIEQETSTTSGAMAVELVSSTATAPGTLVAGNSLVVKHDPSNPAQGFTLTGSGFTGALTGTQTTLARKAFNALTGYPYVPTPEEQIEVAGGQFLWVRLPIVVAATFNVDLTVIEEG